MNFIKSLFSSIIDIIKGNLPKLVLIIIISAILGIILALIQQKPLNQATKKFILEELNNVNVYTKALDKYDPPEPLFIQARKNKTKTKKSKDDKLNANEKNKTKLEHEDKTE